MTESLGGKKQKGEKKSSLQSEALFSVLPTLICIAESQTPVVSFCLEKGRGSYLERQLC